MKDNLAGSLVECPIIRGRGFHMEIEKALGGIMGGYQRACVLFAADNLKIFDEIADRAKGKF